MVATTDIFKSAIQASGVQPEPSDYEWARDYLIANEGIDSMPFGRSIGKIYVSKQPKVFELQVKAMAYGYAIYRQKQTSGIQTPEEIEAQALLSQVIRDKRAAAALVPGTIYQGVSLYEASTKQTQCVKFLLNDYPYLEKPHVLLLGGPGSGKTFAAIGYVASRMKEHATARGSQWDGKFITGRDIHQANGVGFEKTELLKSLRDVKWLIIDDLKTAGEGSVTESYVSLVEDLFCHRHLYGKPTFITSNGTAEAIARTYGERFVSRFRQAGTVQETTENDLRRAS